MEHKEEVQEKHRKYKEEYRETYLAYQERYNREHKDSRRAYFRAYAKKYPQKSIEKAQKRLALKLNQMGEWPLSLAELESILFHTIQFGRCFYCSESITHGKYHRDHMVPLARGGLHDYRNICLACKLCNLRKHTKTAEEFIKQLERESKELTG